MLITTTARHLEVTPEIREFTEKRLAKLTRYANDIREAHLILTAEKYRHSAEIILRLNRHEVVAREETNDVFGSIDRAVERLEHQLKKLAERRKEHPKGDGRAPIPHAGEVLPESGGEPGESDLGGGPVPGS